MKARQSLDARDARRELLPGQSEALLRELHLLTRDGHLNADALRKLKQVNHLVGLLRPALDDVFARFGQPVVVDAASGNGYLAFVLYELFFANAGAQSSHGSKAELHCIDARTELAEQSAARAKRLGFERMRFHAAALKDAPFPERVNLVVALHACDTATDDALAAGIARNADHLAVVPCCQAEVARQLKEAGKAIGGAAMRALHERPWHRREFGAHLTNVTRCLALEAMGYQVTVTELTGWEHSLKNELILARKIRRDDKDAKAVLASLLAETGVKPQLVRTLGLG